MACFVIRVGTAFVVLSACAGHQFSRTRMGDCVSLAFSGPKRNDRRVLTKRARSLQKDRTQTQNSRAAIGKGMRKTDPPPPFFFFSQLGVTERMTNLRNIFRHGRQDRN
ncbi:hypothetical protein BDN70DRAFT_115636 [Pholiota conissans]|uniref:Secreted protein n=1 Tax=Pholiota conissans TaxID=109636 RepID=A0A9P6CYA4_9AGAR|nr:hypothetical protein BDN70DRAFT_115636 [Pholiota conissans]